MLAVADEEPTLLEHEPALAAASIEAELAHKEETLEVNRAKQEILRGRLKELTLLA